MKKFVFRVHAIRRMFERRISDDEVKHIIKTGETIEDYSTDMPYPSALILGWIKNRPIHVVLAYNRDDNKYIVVTAYEPSSKIWEADFKRRKQ
ncbi:MAG TPA: DUF4258 domain-containing protein [Actinobacteria bacterium]|nr:DUF4258 domain-containing protein [Actinomycetes bacterium]HEX21670.1 DUF4258 domain-containing protein [Actinomycetota bacterium]